MGTNKTISTDNTLSLKVLSFSSQISGSEKMTICARKMEMSPESEGAAAPAAPPARTPMTRLKC